MWEDIAGRRESKPDGSPHKFFDWRKEEEGYNTRSAFMEIEKQIEERRRRL